MIEWIIDRVRWGRRWNEGVWIFITKIKNAHKYKLTKIIKLSLKIKIFFYVLIPMSMYPGDSPWTCQVWLKCHFFSAHPLLVFMMEFTTQILNYLFAAYAGMTSGTERG